VDVDLTKPPPEKEPGASLPSGSDKEKPPPFDQDPKWKKARAAEKSLNRIMEKHGFADAEELENAVDEAGSLKAVIGTRDAKKLVEDSEYLNKTKEYWALKKAEEAEANETPEQTIARLKKEKEEIAKSRQREIEDLSDAKRNDEALTSFNKEIGVIVEGAGLPEPESKLLSLFLGVDNPADEVDITDVRAIRKMAKGGVETFSELLGAIKQQAIDDYAAGKTGQPQIPGDVGDVISPELVKGDEEVKTTPPGKESVSGKSVDASFGAAKDIMLKMIRRATGV
jgi:hypothetical protein